jgi:sugar lactone lactonase YvrE
MPNPARSHARSSSYTLALLCLALFCFCAPSSASAQTASFNGVLVPLSGILPALAGEAFDASGNLYIASAFGGPIHEIPKACIHTASINSCVRTLGTGFNNGISVAVDGTGNVFIADRQDSEVAEIPLSCINGANDTSCMTTVGTGIITPSTVAVDSSGNVYVAGLFSTAIQEIPATCISGANNSSCMINLGLNLREPEAVAVDLAGNVYFTAFNGGAVQEIPLSCIHAANDTSCILSLGGGLQYAPYGIAVDASGNVFVADTSSNAAKEIPLSCIQGANDSTCVVTLANTFNQPQGIALDASGNVFVTDTDDFAIDEIVLHGVNLGTINVASTSASLPLTFTITAPGRLGAPKVVTQGATGLDFKDAGSDSCTAGTSYTAGQTCVLNVKFSPTAPGTRYGAAQLLDNSGNVLATAYMQGTGNAPQITFDPATFSSLGGGFAATGETAATALDGNGNVYVAVYGGTTVFEMPAGCASSACVTTLGGGFFAPIGIAVDSAGNVYVADYANSAVYEMPPGCTSASCVTPLGGGFAGPWSVAVDGSANVYIGDFGNNAVKEMPAGCASAACVITLGGGFNQPTGVAVDGSGNVYVADFGNGAVKQMPAGCTSAGCVTTLGGGFNDPAGVAVGGANIVYVTDPYLGGVFSVPPGCASSSCVTPLADGFSYPNGLAVDGSGNVYVADLASGSGTIEALNLATPPTLTFATTYVNSISSDSPQTVRITNIGNTPLTFPLTGSANPSLSTNFTFDGSTTCPLLSGSSSAPDSLAATTSCFLAVSFTPLSAGSISGSAVFTDNNLNASGVNQSIHLNGIAQLNPQPISFNDFPAFTYAPGLTIPLAAGGGASGNPVTFSVLSGPGTVNGNTLTVTGAGTIVVAANQLGNAAYRAAPQAIQAITIHPASQPLSFNVFPAFTYAPGLTIPLTAGGGATNNPVTFSVLSGPGTVNGNTLTVTGAGTIVVAANQLGNANYLAAPQAARPITIHSASQPLSFNVFPAFTYAPGLTISLAAGGGGSGNPVTFSVLSGPGTISGTTLTVTGAGTIVVAANQLGNANYLAAPQAARPITVNSPR